MIPIDFNVKDYKKLNKDLQNMTDEKAITHYKNTGKYENRLYKSRFISLVTMFKNEDNIVHFVEYYKNLGIDHIFLFDNNSDKNYKNDLQQYIDINFVTYFNYNFIPPNGNIDEFWNDNNFPLNQVFNETIDTKSEYIMFFDADEYLHLESTFENFKEKIKSLNCDLLSVPLVNIPFDITINYNNNKYFFGQVNEYDKMIINVNAHKNKRYYNAHAWINNKKYSEITFCNINNTNKINTYLNHYWMDSTKYFIDRFTKIIPQSFTNNEIINLLINNIKPNKCGQYVDRLYKRLEYAQSTLLSINLYDKLLVNNNEKINELLNSYILDINIISLKYPLTNVNKLEKIIKINMLHYLDNSIINKKDDYITIFEFLQRYNQYNKNDNYIDIYLKIILINCNYIDFDPFTYLKLNADLKILLNDDIILSKINLVQHWLYNGCNENRLYKIILPSNFLVENYKKLNEDLQNITDDEAITHYMNTGKNENRNF